MRKCPQQENSMSVCKQEKVGLNGCMITIFSCILKCLLKSFRFLPKILIYFLPEIFLPFYSVSKNPSRLIKPNYGYKIVLKFEKKYCIERYKVSWKQEE